MRRRNSGLYLAFALALSACGEAPNPEQTEAEWSMGESASDAAPGEFLRPTAPGDGLVTPTIATIRPGSWVRDEIGSCSERQEWLVVAPGGDLDHVAAKHGTCGSASFDRHVGRWSTDQQIVKMRWSNPAETVTHQTSYWSQDESLHLGAYVPADGGWLRKDETMREIGGHRTSVQTDVGLRIDGLELVHGSRCHMTATVSADVDGMEITESFAFDCSVSASGDGFIVAADGMWGTEGGWLEYLESRGFWRDHPARAATAVYEAFEPVLFTVDGLALWHREGDSVYRFTDESPPTSMDDVGH